MSDSVSIQIKTILGSILLKFIYGSNRKDVRGRDNYESLIKQGKSVILSVWHGQLLSVVHDLRKEKFYAIAGTHEDAEIISRIATKWGWNMMRGSSKEKGDVAYKNMINALKKPGNAVFITPDGPTGPARVPKPGGIRALQMLPLFQSVSIPLVDGDSPIGILFIWKSPLGKFTSNMENQYFSKKNKILMNVVKY